MAKSTINIGCISNLGSCVVDHLLCGEIALVTHEQLVDVLGGVSVNLLQPLLHVVERVLLRRTSDQALPYIHASHYEVHIQTHTDNHARHRRLTWSVTS
jgi:hypothetical protein